MKGKIPVKIFQVMAVVSALAIGGGYVVWRQAEAKKANKRERVEQAKAEKEHQSLLLSGSKSYTGGTLLNTGDIPKEAGILPPIEGADGKEAPLLPGSKSLSMPLFTEKQIKEMQEKADKEAEIVPQDLLPSSKIGILRLRDKDAEPPKEKELKLLPGSKSAPFEILKEPEMEKSE